MTDDDLDQILALGPRPNGKECATGWCLQQLPPATAEKFRQAMAYNADEDELSAAFARRGLPWASPTSIQRHMRGGCRNCAERTAVAS